MKFYLIWGKSRFFDDKEIEQLDNYFSATNAVSRRADKVSFSENQKRKEKNLYVQQIKGLL